MTEWGAFAGFSGVVVLLLLLLARASQTVLSESAADERPTFERDLAEGSAAEPRVAEPRAADAPATRGEERTGTEKAPSAEPATPADRAATPDDLPADSVDGPGVGDRPPAGRARPAEETLSGTPSFGTGELLANVLVTHGLFAGLVAGAAVYWAVPPRALGVSVPDAWTVAWGFAAGGGLYAANELGATAAAHLGVDHDERLRELLAPETPAGWVLLLGGVLPLVAVSEELIFRGVLVGAFAAGFGLSPWWLAAASSVAFALGHGAQGRGGVLVTGLLGFALAAAFVATGSLALVVVAHYVVNALEFVVHEGLGVEWVE